MQEKPSKACFRTTRGLDAADAVHSYFFSEGVFRGALDIIASHLHIWHYFQDVNAGAIVIIIILI